MTKLDELVSSFNTTPFLFLGSGITRRYYNLPDWKNLLIHFANEVKNDDFAFSSYENLANGKEHPKGLYPLIAELIQRDYDEKWFNDARIRHIDKETAEKIKNGLSPFKGEMAHFIKRNSILNPEYEEEISLLKKLSERNLSGIITTNYDQFIENIFNNFKTYVGQRQLIFSTILGIAEIYKIHGSVDAPESIVINEKDYIEFDNNCPYLAAKLMTIFMEYPIVFIGYSLSDQNIKNIMAAMVNCLDEPQIEQLGKRFIFVEYSSEAEDITITPHSIFLGNKTLTIQKIVLKDFKVLYKALAKKQSKIPVRILRRFKDDLYQFVVENKPTSTLKVATIDDKRIKDEDLILAIGTAKEFGHKGLSGIDLNDWYRNILYDDLSFTADELLSESYENLNKQNSKNIPVFKLLTKAKEAHPEIVKSNKGICFDDLINSSLIKRRSSIKYKSIKDIDSDENINFENKCVLIACLQEKQINVEELKNFLDRIFQENRNILHDSSVKSTNKSHIRRLIRIYDYLKWGNHKK
jgi:hypothetical protein